MTCSLSVCDATIFPPLSLPPLFPLLDVVDGDLQQVPIATISPSTTQQTNNNSHNNDVMYDVIYCEGENPSIIWPNGRLPLDGTPIEVEHFPYPAVMGIVYTYSVVGVMFAVACFFFNLVFRKKR